MDKTTVQDKLTNALHTLIKDHLLLLKFDVNERSITHQLAICLAGEFLDYDVDCEYNRMFREGEQVQKRSIRIEEMATVSIGDLTAKTAYPDIIVHWREDDKHNLLVIEAKKAGADYSEDYRKLNGFMADRNDHGLGYEFSAFVIFDTNTPTNSSVEVKQAGDRW